MAKLLLSFYVALLCINKRKLLLFLIVSRILYEIRFCFIIYTREVGEDHAAMCMCWNCFLISRT